MQPTSFKVSQQTAPEMETFAQKRARVIKFQENESTQKADNTKLVIVPNATATKPPVADSVEKDKIKELEKDPQVGFVRSIYNGTANFIKKIFNFINIFKYFKKQPAIPQAPSTDAKETKPAIPPAPPAPPVPPRKPKAHQPEEKTAESTLAHLAPLEGLTAESFAEKLGFEEAFHFDSEETKPAFPPAPPVPPRRPKANDRPLPPPPVPPRKPKVQA